MQHDSSTSPPLARYLLLLALLALTFFSIRTISNSDFWMHLATGRHIAEAGRPETDPFAYTTGEAVWVNATWLYDAALYRLWDTGGAPLVTLVFAACVVGAFVLLLPLAGPGSGDAARSLGILACAWLVAPTLAVGPHGPALLFTALCMHALARAQTRTVLLVLVPTQIMWTNMHSSFLLGSLIAALFAFEDRRTGGKRLAPWIPLALLAVTFVNPYGFRLHSIAWSTLLNPNSGALLEWISLFHGEFAPSFARHIQTVMLAIVASGFITVSGRLPISITTLGVAGAFLLVLSPRYLAFSGLLLLPFASYSLQGLANWIFRKLDGDAWASAGRSMLAGASALSLLLICSNFYYNRTGSASSFGLGTAKDLFPEDACATILARPEFPTKAIHMIQDGGYLAWRLPGRKIFTDSRAPLYGLEFYQELARGLMGQPEAWTALLEKHQPEAIVLNSSWPGSGAATRRLLDAGEWGLAYFDGTTIVMLRKTREHSRMLQDFELQKSGLKALENSRRTQERTAFTWLPSRNNPRLIGASALYYALLRFSQAETLLLTVTRKSPTYVNGWQQLGICQLQRGKNAEAIASLKRAVSLRKNAILSWLWLSKAYEANGQLAQAEQAMRKARRMNAEVAQTFEASFTNNAAVAESR
ncbi:MAG TPA: hypothetical protein PKE12_07655 [Kiritimatiellia bacterium]|nr:hypothetical protein [Kiritimatiellia bacterium]